MREIIYIPLRAMCADGIERVARTRATIYGEIHPDTAFTVPAYVQVRGRTVRGYIASGDGMAFYQERDPGLEFHAVTYCRNHAMIRKINHD